jgi:hypothetical protein
MSRRSNNTRINKQPKLKNNQILQLRKEFSVDAGDFNTWIDLISNPTNADGYPMTGYVETIGRFSIDCTLEGVSSLDNVAIFVMYIPEGYVIQNMANSSFSVLNQHPEWIMAYKYLGSPTQSSGELAGQGCQPTRIRSRVRRNLMTGDRIVLLISGTNSSSTSSTGTLWAYLKFASRIN